MGGRSRWSRRGLCALTQCISLINEYFHSKHSGIAIEHLIHTLNCARKDGLTHEFKHSCVITICQSNPLICSQRESSPPRFFFQGYVPASCFGSHFFCLPACLPLWKLNSVLPVPPPPSPKPRPARVGHHPCAVVWERPPHLHLWI